MNVLRFKESRRAACFGVIANAMLVEIRRAISSDAADLARMRAASSFERKGGDPSAREEHARLCEAFFARELALPHSFLHPWVAIVRGAIVGSASLTIVQTLPRYGWAFSGFDGRVRDVYVDPAHRRTGIAKALMTAVLADARARRVDRLSLGASEMGRPLYEKIGFVGKNDEMILDS